MAGTTGNAAGRVSNIKEKKRHKTQSGSYTKDLSKLVAEDQLVLMDDPPYAIFFVAMVSIICGLIVLGIGASNEAPFSFIILYNNYFIPSRHSSR